MAVATLRSFMTVGTILIDWNPDRTDQEICDDLLEYDVVIAELGTRPTKTHRTKAISEQLRKHPDRWGKEDGNVLLVTYVVNSEGHICTYDTIDDIDNYDEFDVLFFSDADGVGVAGVEAGIEKLTVEWRKRGKPRRYATHFEHGFDEDDEDA
jgi:hypothetical protein